VAVTLIDLALSLAIGLMTWIAARTLPTVLEIVLRLRGGVGPGSRLALAALLRYGIATIGAIWALDMLGASWSKLQWMAAALGVGIGFGLQEIIANFISGLIILIERPVRIGDVVTVGDATGKITRVQIRATTLRNWDQQELLVPNKEFISGRVLNWSLSDENIRINFEVGIAYGSDAAKALELLSEAIAEQPITLDDPAPLVTFERFGDNALVLGVRCYIPNLNKRLETITALHLAIDRKFREAGIVIAFPQRDVHIDMTQPLEVRLNRTPPDDEVDLRVEVIVGRVVKVDAVNHYFLGGRIKPSIIDGWGFTRYVVDALGPMGSTLMAPEHGAPATPRFVALRDEPYLVRYNRRLPLLVYVRRAAKCAIACGRRNRNRSSCRKADSRVDSSRSSCSEGQFEPQVRAPEN
jgi:small-conductance mechanosensitive channel